MKNYVIEIVKDLIISILLIACIVIILSLVFYDKIALSRVIPEAEAYFLTEEMEQEIEESNLEESEEVIINYYIDAADLKKYEKANEYVKGKSHPFAVTSSYDEGNNSVTTNNETSSNSSNTNTGFFKDDGIK